MRGVKQPLINQKTINEIGSSLSVSVTESHSFKKGNLSKYRTLFKKYKVKNIIKASSFDDSHWAIVDFIGNRRNLYYDLKYPTLNNALKCFILINISSDFTINHIASLQSKLRNVIKVTEGFKKDKVEELEEYVQKASYTNRFKTLVYINNFLEFVEHKNRNEYNNIKISIRDIKNKNRDLPNYETIVDFHYAIKEFEQNGNSYEKEKFYPVILWWKITSLIPMRPKEFCLLKNHCTYKKNNQYFLKIPRTKIKAKSNSDLDIENTIRINKEIYESIEEYKHSIPNNLIGEYLFSYQIQMRFFTTRKKLKRRIDILHPDKLHFLLSKFYKEVQGWAKQDFIKEKRNDREVRNYVTPGDTRHFSICNLMLQGINPLSIAKMAGHVRLNTQRNYWGHLEYFVESFVYILTSKNRMNRLEKDLGKGVFSFMDKVDESKIFSPDDFESTQEVEHGFCKNRSFPENCPGECRYCDFYLFYPSNYEEGIKWLQNDSELLEQQLTTELISLLEIYKNMKFNLKTESYSIINQEQALSKANLLNRLIKQKAMIDSLIPETKEVNL